LSKVFLIKKAPRIKSWGLSYFSLMSIVEKLKTKNIGILITDHNVQETLSITDRAYLMFEGGILKAGTAEELAADEMVRKVYLGMHFVLKKKVAAV
jgi:lipopolysaccharide export system ATP-binding protein